MRWEGSPFSTSKLLHGLKQLPLWPAEATCLEDVHIAPLADRFWMWTLNKLRDLQLKRIEAGGSIVDKAFLVIEKTIRHLHQRYVVKLPSKCTAFIYLGTARIQLDRVVHLNCRALTGPQDLHWWGEEGMDASTADDWRTKSSII